MNNFLPILHVCLCQLCYIVPIIIALEKYFTLKFYYIVNNNTTKSGLNLLELVKIGIQINHMEIFTQEQFNNFVYSKFYDNELFLITSYLDIFGNVIKFDKGHNEIKKLERIKLAFGHGIDEEVNILGKKHIDAPTELKINASLYSVIYRNIIRKIYDIDPNKKTLVFFETTSLWLFKRTCQQEVILREYHNELINVLISLKDKYNIILRSHPQDYHHYYMTGNPICSDLVKNNFVMEYMPIPVFNLYEIADFVISSRFSASGYQAMFVKNKNYIILEHDFDSRQLYSKDNFLHSHSNQQIENLKQQQLIADNSIVPILYENKASELHGILKLLESNQLAYENAKDEFVERIFGIQRSPINELINNDELNNYVQKRLEKLKK